jgi:hypothetical protein
MNLIDGIPDSPSDFSGADCEAGVLVAGDIAESSDGSPPRRGERRIVAPRNSAGVGPRAAVDALFRFIPTPPVLRSGDADSVVDAGFKESLLNPLRPCTVGSQPFSLL